MRVYQERNLPNGKARFKEYYLILHAYYTIMQTAKGI